RYRADAEVEEAIEPADDLEREANRVAAELLMPAEGCRARADELRRGGGGGPPGGVGCPRAGGPARSGRAQPRRLPRACGGGRGAGGGSGGGRRGRVARGPPAGPGRPPPAPAGRPPPGRRPAGPARPRG